MKTHTPVRYLTPGMNFYAGAEDATVTQVILMPALDGREYDDFRGNGPYYRVRFTAWDPSVGKIVEQIKDYAPNAMVLAGPGL